MFVTFPYPAIRANAKLNNRWLAKQFLERSLSYIRGRRLAEGCRCQACNRKPRNELCEVVLDPNENLIARIGIGRCHFDFFRGAIEELLVEERNGNHANREARICKLETAIQSLSWNL